MGFRDRLSHAWNVFTGSEGRLLDQNLQYGPQTSGSSYRTDRPRRFSSAERSIISSVYTRIGIDVAGVLLKHARLDENKRYLEDIDSGLNRCLTVEANIDQAARHFRQDLAMTILEKGVVAVLAVETDLNPSETGGYDIKTIRVAEIESWYPQHVKISALNDKTGKREELIVAKKDIAIIENPLYAVMNEPNSTLQRLIRKLNILDAIDEQSGSGKLDLIVQLPYSLRSESKRTQAQQRRTDLEDQLSGSKYGVGYIDASEKVIQLNRGAENNLLSQIEYLTNMLYQQLGMTPKVFDGTADEAEMLNYFNRTIEPILAAITENLSRKFLTKTAISQRQSVIYSWDPFKLVPIKEIAEIADKFTRNEIASSNEIRGILGWKPSKDPNADKLQNKNLNQPEEVTAKKESKAIDIGQLEPLATPAGASASDGTTSK